MPDTFIGPGASVNKVKALLKGNNLAKLEPAPADFVSLEDLIFSGLEVYKIADAVRDDGCYGWDKYGRFVSTDFTQDHALHYLARVFEALRDDSVTEYAIAFDLASAKLHGVGQYFGMRESEVVGGLKKLEKDSGEQTPTNLINKSESSARPSPRALISTYVDLAYTALLEKGVHPTARLVYEQLLEASEINGVRIERSTVERATKAAIRGRVDRIRSNGR